MLYLLRFDFTLKYVPETKMENADRLSRRPDWKVRIDKDNDNQIFIKNHWLCRLLEVVRRARGKYIKKNKNSQE